MRLPVFESVTQGINKILRRFPFSMLAALIGTISAYSIVHFDYLEDEWSLYRLLMTAVLGFLLFSVLQLKLEREKFGKKSEQLLKGFGALFLVLYYWLLPNDFDFASAAFVIRFFLLGLALLFSLSFVPFIRHLKEINGFWQYNKILFIRLFFTFVFTGTLYLGLVLALVGAKQLLDIDFDEKLFFEMWIVIVGLISTSFFLVGVPDKTADLQKKTDYYKGIRIFAQFILIPLILIYAVILYIYTGKILIHWDWPEGMVSWLIIVFSLATILANFMLYPLFKKEKWVRYFSRISYALIIPMTLVMFLAFKIRISEYGITELRYYGVVLCFWFLLTSLYFILSKKKNLIYLPVSLFIITIISSAGPLSSMNVSKWSQLNRLESVLVKNELLVDGKIQKTGKEVSKEDIAVISGTLDYIERVHGYDVIQPWFDQDLETLEQNSTCYGPECVMELMGLDYLSQWERMTPRVDGFDDRYRNYHADERDALKIEGYNYIQPFYLNDIRFDGPYHKLSLSPDKQRIIVARDDGVRTTINMKPFIDSLLLSAVQERHWDDMRIDNNSMSLVFRNFSILIDELNQIEEITGIDGYLLTK